MVFEAVIAAQLVSEEISISIFPLPTALPWGWLSLEMTNAKVRTHPINQGAVRGDTSSDLLWNLSCCSLAAAVAGVLCLERLNRAWEQWNHNSECSSNVPCLLPALQAATACLELIWTAHISIATGSRNLSPVQEFSTSPLNKSLKCYKLQSTPVLSWWMCISSNPWNVRLIGGYW